MFSCIHSLLRKFVHTLSVEIIKKIMFEKIGCKISWKIIRKNIF